jgi:hypothetical protein
MNATPPRWALPAALVLFLCARAQAQAQPPTRHDLFVKIDSPAGPIRPLHGLNNGPLDAGGTVDLSDAFRALHVPSVRLHDDHWPVPDVVDLSVVFPNPAADPAAESSYDFRRTDPYLKAIAATGARIVYRLGQSIEHEPVKLHVDPPADPSRWAAACVGIIRHCNDGWANGMHLDIRDWEVWNEPENRPVMWTGTDAQYFDLYRQTALAIKAHDPTLRVGGPALGYVGKILPDGSLEPSEFTSGFLQLCQREHLPLDFFSWHIYTNDPDAVVQLARGVRTLLDQHGFHQTQSVLTEWNFIPDGKWLPAVGEGQGEPRTRWFERINGDEGAAFTLAVLIALQDAPVDQAHYYSGDTKPFGLFNQLGLARAPYHAMKAFGDLAQTAPQRLPVEIVNDQSLSQEGRGLSQFCEVREAKWDCPPLPGPLGTDSQRGLWSLAALVGDEVHVLVALTHPGRQEIHVHCEGHPERTQVIEGPAWALLRLATARQTSDSKKEVHK